jgi:hypothetical protein
MSDNESIELVSDEIPKKKYQCTKEIDLRKHKSKENIQKALAARKQNFLKIKKERLESSLNEINKIEINDSSDSSSEEEIILKKRDKKTPKKDDSETRFQNIETMLYNLTKNKSKSKSKSKPQEKKTVIEIHTAKPNKKNDDSEELINGIKRKLLLKL